MDTIVKDTRTKKQIKQEARDKARDRLEKIVGVYDQDIFCIIRHVSQSGMTRHISFFNIVSGQPFFLDGLIRDYLGYRYNKTYTGLVVEGCGMDMAFSVVNHLQVQMSHDKNCYWKEYNFRHRII